MKYLRYLRKVIDKIFAKCSLFNLLLVIEVTLFPFDFDFRENFSFKEILTSFYHSSNFIDAILNIVLFIFVGYSVSELIQKNYIKPMKVLRKVFVASAFLSCCIEVLQVFLPSRSSTFVDILTNSIGGCIGFFIFYHCNYKIKSYCQDIVLKLRRYLPIKILLIGLITYITFISTQLVSRTEVATLENWNLYYPLTLWNERTGDRPWYGYISSFQITNRDLSQKEVVNIFAANEKLATKSGKWIFGCQFVGDNNCYSLQSMHKQLWQSESYSDEKSLSKYFGQTTWLQTSKPFTSVVSEIRKTSKFALNITFATSNVSQTGPARIISLSNGPYERNFTLAQQASDLVVRLRTPVTGENGSSPEIIIRNVLSDLENHHLVLNYTGKVLKLYLDDIQNLFVFDIFPEVALFKVINRPNSPLSKASMTSYKVLFDLIIYWPLGFTLGFVEAVFVRKLVVFVFLRYSGAIAIVATIELNLSEGLINSTSLGNIVLSSMITISIAILVKSIFTLSSIKKKCFEINM